MTVEKYVVLLDADHAVTPGERDDAVGRLVEGAGGAGAGLVGLTVSSLTEVADRSGRDYCGGAGVD